MSTHGKKMKKMAGTTSYSNKSEPIKVFGKMYTERPGMAGGTSLSARQLAKMQATNAVYDVKKKARSIKGKVLAKTKAAGALKNQKKKRRGPKTNPMTGRRRY